VPEDKLFEFIDEDGVEFMKLVVDVTLYWRGTAFDHRAGILHFYRTALPLIRSRLNFYERENMRGAKRLTPAALKQLSDWLGGSDRTKDIYSMHLYGGTKRNVSSDVALQFQSDEDLDEGPAGMIRLVLPTTFVDENPRALLDLTLSLARKLDFHSGYAGYSINWDPLGWQAHDAQKRMTIFARRFPAIDLPSGATGTTLMAIAAGLKRISWITLVGNKLMKEKRLAKSALKRLEVHRLPHGIAVVAGDRPRLGDVKRKEDLSAYRRVGKALAKLRSTTFVGFIYGKAEIDDDDRTHEWLRYFDR